MKYTYEQAIAAFWAKVDVRGPDECWPWLGAKLRDGYGSVKFCGQPLSSHRVAFFLSNGMLSEGKDICHTCDNPPCCNPLHLFAGTRKQNIEDCVAKDRQNKGIDHRLAKLNDELVRCLRKDHEAGMGCRRLASKYQIHRATVSQVLKGITWKHVTD